MRRGSILLEVLLSIALFVGAGAYCLASTRSVLDALDRTQREARALDLARSKLAELQAGLTSITQLEAPWSGEVGSYQPDALEQLDIDLPWTIDVESAATEFGDLSLVTMTVAENAGEGAAPISVTLRALVLLRDVEPQDVEADDLLDDLPPPEVEEGASPTGGAASGDVPQPPGDEPGGEP